MVKLKLSKKEILINNSTIALIPLILFNPLSVSPIKWLNTIKHFVGNLLTNCLSLFDHFVGVALKG